MGYFLVMSQEGCADRWIHILTSGLTIVQENINSLYSAHFFIFFFVVMNTTRAVVKIRPEKDSDLYGILNHDLCDTGAVLYHGRNQVMGS